MEFNKKLIYKIIDNKIDKIRLYGLTKQGLNILYNALNLNHSLKELDLSYNKIKDIIPLKFLSNSCLKSLCLNGNKINDHDIQKIKELAKLKQIKLKI